MSLDFWSIVAAATLGGILAKLASLVIDALLWLRSWMVAFAAEAGRRRKVCK